MAFGAGSAEISTRGWSTQLTPKLTGLKRIFSSQWSRQHLTDGYGLVYGARLVMVTDIITCKMGLLPIYPHVLSLSCCRWPVAPASSSVARLGWEPQRWLLDNNFRCWLLFGRDSSFDFWQWPGFPAATLNLVKLRHVISSEFMEKWVAWMVKTFWQQQNDKTRQPSTGLLQHIRDSKGLHISVPSRLQQGFVVFGNDTTPTTTLLGKLHGGAAKQGSRPLRSCKTQAVSLRIFYLVWFWPRLG